MEKEKWYNSEFGKNAGWGVLTAGIGLGLLLTFKGCSYNNEIGTKERIEYLETIEKIGEKDPELAKRMFNFYIERLTIEKE